MSVVLSEHLPLQASARDGIQKLRGLILELAVRGKLVPQDPDDEPASELLKRIGAQKKSQSSNEAPRPLMLDLPAGWSATSLNDYALGVFTGPFGSVLHQSDYTTGGIPLVNPSHMINDKIVPDDRITVSQDVAERLSSYRLAAGDIVMARRGEVGRAALVAVSQAGWLCGTGSFFLNFSSEVNRDYLLLILRSGTMRTYLSGQAVGTTMVNLNHGILKRAPLAIPPLPEQHRIVAKVDELTALCDRLEAEQANAASAHARLVETLLGTLTQSTDAADLAANWQRLAEHFDTLFTTEASIDALKQTVLQLAVMGKLVLQNFADEPAQDLLNRIQKEFVTTDAAVRVRRVKPLPPVGDEEKPFEAPTNWEWIRLQDIINVSSGEGLTSEKMAEAGDVPVYGGNGVTGRHDQANIDKPTLVIGRVGFYCGSIHLTPAKAWVTDNALRVRFSEKNLNIEFLFWLLKATNLKGNESATAQPLVSGKTIYPIVVALPPLAEQHRIVAKVDELMALCDRLKADLATARQHQATLADTLIEAALEVA